MSAKAQKTTRSDTPSQPIDPNDAANDEATAAAPVPASTSALKAATERQPRKSDAVLKLLRRKRGATLAELQAATGWQAHLVRGFLSGTVRKRMQLILSTEPGSDGVRHYRIVADAASTDTATSEVDAASAPALEAPASGPAA